MPRNAGTKSAGSAAVIGAILLLGCTDSRPSEPAEAQVEEVVGSSVDPVLPQLKQIDAANNPDRDDLTQYSSVAIGPQGTLAFTSPRWDPPVQLLDAVTGNTIPLGPAGDGPAELRDPLVLSITDSAVFLLDRANLRLSTWSLEGRLLQESPVGSSLLPVVAPLSSGREWLLQTTAGGALNLAVLSAATGALVAVDLSQSEFLDRHWGAPSEPITNRPAIGLWPGGFILADVLSYDIGLFDWGGRLMHRISPDPGPNLPGETNLIRRSLALGQSNRVLEADRLERQDSEPEPWFSLIVRQDAKGRTWFVGERNDSAYADVYAGPVHLGRLELPCFGIGPRWDLSGSWLAVICLPDDPTANDDAVLKRFRIEG